MFYGTNEEESQSETDENHKSTSSSEGEYNLHCVQDEEEFQMPNFGMIQDWNPKGTAGLQYICLFPVSFPQVRYYNSVSEQSPHVNKVRVSSTHRQQRLREFKLGNTTGRNILDEKRLQKAASDNQFETVLELLDSGVDPCSCDGKQRTALHFASSQGNELIVKVLLDRGADPNSKDVLGNTPMHLAAITGHVPVVTLLLKAGTNVKSMDNNGRTPLNLAKARLKVLSASNQLRSSAQLKQEVGQICEMMMAYMDISGQNKASEQISQLCERLERSSTREEVDAVNALLADFTGLNIKKDSDNG